jgi:hypothetical protein
MQMNLLFPNFSRSSRFHGALPNYPLNSKMLKNASAKLALASRNRFANIIGPFFFGDWIGLK